MKSSNLQSLFETVAAQDLDVIPHDFDSKERFVFNSIRAATQRSNLSAICAFVYSEAPRPETASFGFSRIAHMQDGYGKLDGHIVATNQDANNGMHRLCNSPSPEGIMDELEKLNFQNRCTVIWDAGPCVATIYPQGISSLDNHVRHNCNINDKDLSQDEVRCALNTTYEENLKNPSAHTVRLWSKLTLIERAEDEIERHIKGQLTMYFIGRKRPIKILPQTNTNAGRCDLLFLQRQGDSGPKIVGVLELKVLRGPKTKNKKITSEGLSQGYHYRQDLGLPFAILSLFDVSDSPTDSLGEVLTNQPSNYLEMVLVIRYPIYNSPKSWRDSQV